MSYIYLSLFRISIGRGRKEVLRCSEACVHENLTRKVAYLMYRVSVYSAQLLSHCSEATTIQVFHNFQLAMILKTNQVDITLAGLGERGYRI